MKLSTAALVALTGVLILAGALRAASGGLDPSFGTRGRAVASFGEGDNAAAILLQPDGKVVLVGETEVGIAVVRYGPNGRLDRSFGRNGKSIIPCAARGSLCGAYSVAVDGEGALILGGVEFGRRGEFAVARLKPDGNRDSAFGIGGWAESAFEGGVFGIGVQPDGKILVAGHHHEPRSADPRTYLAVARLTAQGRLDTSFARSGRALINLGGSPEVSSGFLEPSGKLVIVFSDLDRRERDQVTLARVNANGRIDRTFGHGGIVRTPVGGEGPGLAVQSNGKVIVSGARGNSLLVARYSRNGRIDTSFGRAGLARRAFPRESLMEGGLGIDSEGRILVAGLRTITVYRGSTSMLRSRLVLVRFSRNGRLDRSFGRRGKAGGFGKNYDQPNAIVLQRDDKTLVAGTRYFSQVDKTAFFVARYLPS